jgi:pyocin large subunit-like protein
MSTKGASNRYGNSRGSKHKGQASEHINYPWAKDFNKKSLDTHFDDHAKSMGFDSKESYKQHAIKFANTVDRKNCESFVDGRTGATYKYNRVTNEFAIITKDGYVTTYYKPKGGYGYYKKQIDLYGKH